MVLEGIFFFQLKGFDNYIRFRLILIPFDGNIDHNIINMYFARTPSHQGNFASKLSPKTAATDKQSSFFRSRTVMDGMLGTLNHMIHES